MAFDVVVTEQAEFSSWLAQQRRPADEPTVPLALQGREQFFMNGCAACHAIVGTAAKGVIGPDLTHVGSRLSIGAGIVPNSLEGFRRWLALTEKVKPEVHMPHFGMLPAEELDALAAYLESLQ
jgi:cytochrome c oxidase subunit 2